MRDYIKAPFLSAIFLICIVDCQIYHANNIAEEPNMTDDYIEAILIWSEKGPSTAVGAWFTKRGLKVASMRKGLLISGGQSIFEDVFQVEPLRQERPLALPVPAELTDHVSAVTIPKPRRF
jgi:hypothetical protein